MWSVLKVEKVEDTVPFTKGAACDDREKSKGRCLISRGIALA